MSTQVGCMLSMEDIKTCPANYKLLITEIHFSEVIYSFGSCLLIFL